MIWEVFATFAEVFTGYYFISSVSGSKSVNYKRYLLLTLITTAVVTFANSIKLYSGWTIIVSFLFMAVMIFITEKKQVKDIFTLTAFYFILMLLIDFFVLSVQGIILERPFLPRLIVRSLSCERSIFLFVSKTCLVIVSLAIGKLFRDFRLTYHSNVIFTIAGILIVSFLGIQTFKGVDGDIITSWLLFFALLFSTLFLLSVFKAYKDNVKEQQLLTVRNELMAEQIKRFLESDYEQKKLTHDIRAHLMILSGMIEGGSQEEALEYIYTLIDPVVQGQFVTWTGNEITDFILNTYLKKALDNHIHMEIDSDCVLFSGKEANDLCSIFCNLLDNAFEAVMNVDENQRTVDVSIRKFDEIIVIRITNAIASKPIIKNGKLVTSKKNKKLHGLGLNSIEDMVNKYNGLFSYHFDSNDFTSIVTFFDSE